MNNFTLFRHCKKTASLFLYRSGQVRYGSSSLIKKVLIANRGEIACRVARTARRLGIQVVAVYSDPDASALHVSLADEAYRLGPAASSESYLRGDKLVELAQKSGCQAVHPGYGFLSENAEFAERCQQAGVIFIGPPPAAIRDMGCKSTSKKIMEAAGVPVVKGYHGDDQSDAKLKEEADKIGYPVMLKALKGGGGKGMRVVENGEQFSQQLASARSEASKAFGDTAMLVEKFVSHPRHVEVQVFGDRHGNYLHLHERDCSVQRRHQKIIEEAPAPGLPGDVRTALGEAAVRAARAVSYVGAGTVEFILDSATHQHFFMEMNTRLQVEHPVTEMITSTDLVEWQFKVAAGEELPLSQDGIRAEGHAFEARVYAEDPDNDFLPQAGLIHHLRLPSSASSPLQGDRGVRVDTGVRGGDSVSVFYDPMIAKLIVWGENRTIALQRLRSSLAAFQVGGVPTNVNFLLALARHPVFENGDVHTNFIPEHSEELLRGLQLGRTVLSTAVAALLYNEARRETGGVKPTANLTSDAFLAHPGFRLNHNLHRTIQLTWKGEVISVSVEYLRDGCKRVSWETSNGTREEFKMVAECEEAGDAAINVVTTNDGHMDRATAVVTDHQIQVFAGEGSYTLELPQPSWGGELGDDFDTGVGSGHNAVSPMPGVVDQVLVAALDPVTKGQPLLTVIAMKMEYVIRAPSDGTVAELLHKPGDAVAKGAVLVRLQPADTQASATLTSSS